jgi:glutamate N-acetyltransferase/amino-acid N-acetyltransferase
MSRLDVKGFKWAGVRAGLKANGKRDVGLIVGEEPLAAAAVFTRNVVRAAPVELASRHVRGGRISAVLVNSGNANACTGKAGERACAETVNAIAGALGMSPKQVFPASTGVIGKVLPADKILRVVPDLLADLDAGHAAHFSEAILTTDQWEKNARTTFRVGGSSATVVAIAKGAGMIHPDMATTLAFVATDAVVAPAVLRRALRSAADRTFNALSVDGDTSTNDTILALASSRTGRAVGASGAGFAALEAALADVLGTVGELIVKDGEGAEHVVRIEVRGTKNDDAARKIASTIARSSLVKTALYGKDPNWGRIVAAAGRAGVRFDPSRVTVSIGGVAIVRGGAALGGKTEARVAKAMKQPKYTIELSVGAGAGRAHYLTCDLGHGYVNVNADYRT